MRGIRFFLLGFGLFALAFSHPLAAEDTADPASVELKLVCGSKEFGNRSCDVVKNDIKSMVKTRMSNVLAYFYDGLLIDYTLYGLEKNPTGMCYTGSPFDRVPCDSTENIVKKGVNRRGLACGAPSPAMAAGAPPTPEQCFNTYPSLTKANCGEAMYNFGLDVRKARQNAIDELGKAIKSCKDNGYVEQKGVRQPCVYSIAGLALRARLSALENDFNDSAKWRTTLVSSWKEVQSHGAGYCSFTQNSVQISSCTKEKSYMYGYRVMLWQAYLDQVLGEIENQKLDLVQFGSGGDRPCAQWAVDLKKDVAAIEEQEAVVRDKYKDLTKQIGQNAFEGCIGAENIDYLKLSDKEAKKMAEDLIAKTEKNSKQGGEAIKERDKVVSGAVCPLVLARLKMVARFSKLATCEVMRRTDQAVTDTIVNGDNVMSELSKNVVKGCASEAEDSVGFFSKCQSESCAWGVFYDCYRGKIDGFFGGYIQSQIARRGLASGGTTASDEKLKDAKGQSVDVSKIPACSSVVGLSLAARGGRRRGRKRKALGGRSALLVAALLALALAFGVIGCADGSGDPFDAGAPLCEDQSPKPASGDCKHDNQTPPAADQGGKGTDPKGDVQDSKAVTGPEGSLVTKPGATGKPPSAPGGGHGGGAATAATDPHKDSAPGGKFRSGDGGPGGAGGLPAAKNPGVGGIGANTSTASGGSESGLSDSLGGGAATAADKLGAGQDGTGSKIYTGSTGPGDSSGSGGGAGMAAARNVAGSGSGSDVIASGGSDSTGGDGYLQNNGALSLFEIVNKRYTTWGTELHKTGALE